MSTAPLVDVIEIAPNVRRFVALMLPSVVSVMFSSPAPETPSADQTTLDDQTVMPGLEVSRINPAVISRMGLLLSQTRYGSWR